ncbi:MAG: UDPGP type 1 family protein [Planctomycetes bacterium]|nr:UDPGP type 1 family protein [Planctomycetota bacterium]
MKLMREQRERLRKLGQEHLLAFVDELDDTGREVLVRQIAGSDIEKVLRLYERLVKGGSAAGGVPPVEEIKAPPFISYPRGPEEWPAWKEARDAGAGILRRGEAACLMVAGGQGSRLGFDGPKGCFPIGPVTGRTLFQIQFEKVVGAGRRYGRPVPFFIMVSETNEEATREFLEGEGYFGADAGDVYFFRQENLPAVDEDGKIVLAEKGKLFTSPNGHGGCVEALAKNGALEEMERRGAKYVSYFQVDNPLVRAVDPYFIGFHVMSGAEMSLKAVRKREPSEKVGNIVMHRGRLKVIEYSDLPDSAANLRDDRGNLVIGMGSIAIHMFSTGFLRRMASEGGGLPFHVAHKKIRRVDGDGKPVEPDRPNGYKFEMFIFDSLPAAEKATVVETMRENEFSPVKNAEGVSSPATSRADMARVYRDWLKQAGAKGAEGEAAVEISPLVAGDAEELEEAMGGRVPAVRDGLVLDGRQPGEE